MLSIGEAIAIKPENIDFDKNVVHIHGTLDKTLGYAKGLKPQPKLLQVFGQSRSQKEK